MIRISPFKKTDCRGFTLIELMVVIVILGILAGLIIPRIMGRPEEAKQLKGKIQIESLETALNLYKLDNGGYPDTEQGLQALIEKPETGKLSKKWRKHNDNLNEIPLHWHYPTLEEVSLDFWMLSKNIAVPLQQI